MNNIHSKIFSALVRAVNIEKAIEQLRAFDFRFLEADSIKFSIEPKKEWHGKYSFMVRKVDSKQWDDTFVVGIKMWGKKTSKLLIYHDGVWIRTISKNWKDKADINFRKIVVKLKFPDYLNYEERRAWRTEYHKQKNNASRLPSEWYLKHLPNIQFI